MRLVSIQRRKFKVSLSRFQWKSCDKNTCFYSVLTNARWKSIHSWYDSTSARGLFPFKNFCPASTLHSTCASSTFFCWTNHSKKTLSYSIHKRRRLETQQKCIYCQIFSDKDVESSKRIWARGLHVFHAKQGMTTTKILINNETHSQIVWKSLLHQLLHGFVVVVLSCLIDELILSQDTLSHSILKSRVQFFQS